MTQHDRQNLRGEALELRVLTGPDLPLEKLRRLLVIRDLPANVGKVKFRAVELLQLVPQRLVLVVELARLRYIGRLHQLHQLLIGPPVIGDHLAAKILDRLRVSLSLGQLPEFDLGLAADRRRVNEQPIIVVRLMRRRSAGG